MTVFHRRQFVQAGAAALTVPAYLLGCGSQPRAPRQPSRRLRPRPPANPFYAWFGIDEPRITQVMAALTANGADDAELYFQHSRSNSISMEDGIIQPRLRLGRPWRWASRRDRRPGWLRVHRGPQHRSHARCCPRPPRRSPGEPRSRPPPSSRPSSIRATTISAFRGAMSASSRNFPSSSKSPH